MGLFNRIFKRKLTPEQQEEQSRREKEWAEKCYRAGQNFGDRIAFSQKVDALNRFANRYPRTFFAIITAIVGGSLVLNLTFTSFRGMLDSKTEQPQPLQHFEAVDPQVKQAIDKLYDEMETLTGRIDRYLEKDSLTHEDSVQVKDMLLRIHEIETLLDSGQTTEQ